MNLSESEIEIAQKQIKKWEKFEKKWPSMRWYAIFLSFLLAASTMVLFFAGGRMWEITEKWPIQNVEAADIKAYLDIRTNVLRGEIIRYISTTFQLGFSAIIFGITIAGWNRHKYIRLKVLALRSFLEKNQKDSS